MGELMQEINLYQPMFRRVRTQFGLHSMFAFLAAALGVMMLMYAVGYWQQSRVQDRVQQLRAEVAHNDQSLQRLQAKASPRQANHLLAVEVERLQNSFRQKSLLMQLLQHTETTPANTFSELFAGLARQRTEGVWLSEVQVADGGRQVALRGGSLMPELVPRLLQSLRAEPAFAGRAFAEVRMQRSGEDQQGAVEFSLKTGDGGDKDEPAG